MEAIVKSIYLTRIPNSQTCSASLFNPPLLLQSNATSVTFNSATHHLHKCFLSQQRYGVLLSKSKEKGNMGAIYASEAASPTTTVTERWILEPIGDGDSRHIGFKVERPGAYEIASSEVTVGRVPDKADLVIPVATVSGVHARIRKKQDNLLVIDLDSTNGTYVDDIRLRPGVVTTVSSGSCITFGDTNLAMFRVSKIQGEKVVDTVGETEGELDNGDKSDSTETS
ncbi:zeaxanthin epoxidase chloroplastic-like [Trifolium pratense]|uniref:Zeaxanthin epoxidase chloroplastic-like n=1 Tax=Trifolium pratense TaxID=57577 RepID=A0A2K3N5Y2_TRIPR|nr:zeaxanthin epoxidase chloroplastic-like [Trifolium pratense]